MQTANNISLYWKNNLTVIITVTRFITLKIFFAFTIVAPFWKKKEVRGWGKGFCQLIPRVGTILNSPKLIMLPHLNPLWLFFLSTILDLSNSPPPDGKQQWRSPTSSFFNDFLSKLWIFEYDGSFVWQIFDAITSHASSRDLFLCLKRTD